MRGEVWNAAAPFIHGGAFPSRQERRRRLAGHVAKGEAERGGRREAERGGDLLDRDARLAEPFDRRDHPRALLPRFQRELGLLGKQPGQRPAGNSGLGRERLQVAVGGRIAEDDVGDLTRLGMGRHRHEGRRIAGIAQVHHHQLRQRQLARRVAVGLEHRQDRFAHQRADPNDELVGDRSRRPLLRQPARLEVDGPHLDVGQHVD